VVALLKLRCSGEDVHLRAERTASFGADYTASRVRRGKLPRRSAQITASCIAAAR
jgi:hypothetical protein